MKDPILVLLAAGIGSRYGGLKQMDKLGRNGEVLLDYSVFDAVRSGFKKIVFIIRHEIEKDFRELVLARMESKVHCELAFQENDSLIPPDIFAKAQKAGRTKPWGTTHAVLCAEANIDGPFAVINADDFYGRGAFEVIGKHLCGPFSNEPVIVPYRLDKTLSIEGTVSRGVCEIKDGYLLSVDELTAIEEKDGQIINTNPDGSITKLMADSPVSMNFWGFPHTILSEFKKSFDNYLRIFDDDVNGQLKSESFLPKTVDYVIKEGIAKVKVLNADSDWFGVTYKEDREAAVLKLDGLKKSGIYPETLW